MTKDEILTEIKRITEKDGSPPGRQRFEKLTGIPMHVWYGNFWARWGDALNEAGFTPNQLQGASDTEALIQKYLKLVDSLGRVPTDGDIRLESKNNAEFPSHSTMRVRLGNKNKLLQTVLDYARSNGYSAEKISILEEAITPEKSETMLDDSKGGNSGFVYLMKSGKYYKIGMTNSPDRRQYEIGLHLPEAIQPIHSIETDDPSGIEAYWHNRFKDRRLNGEWFELSASDVRIFRKRKFM